MPAGGLVFYLGTHQPHWLASAGVPLFVSARRLRKRRRLPVAACRWALDSGGFTELSMHGRWTVSPQQYAREVRRFVEGIGSLDWAAPQDWMCEPSVRQRTGLTVADHQRLTVDNYLTLTTLAPGLPWVPVLQGWEFTNYLDHVEQYTRAGVDLASLPVVGVGSVCRRQDTTFAAELFAELASCGIRCHGFGVKAGGLARAAHLLASADSMAWSYAARYQQPLPGCTHRNCANCLPYALGWRQQVLAGLERSRQLQLF